MKAVFFLKINNATKKVHEEELPPEVSEKVMTVLGLVAFGVTGTADKVQRYVTFKRIDAPMIDDSVMFMFDADEYVLNNNEKIKP